jgi:hypothetical protein
MPVLHQDLISLLSLVYSSTTKLALALKPSSPDYPASLGPLRDIASHVSDLARCASLFNPTIHGATLTREIASVVKDVIESVRSLVLAFTGIESNGTRGAGKGWDEYMVRTGTVHDLIDKARGEDGLPKNNIDAVRKKWTQDKDSLDDGLRELGEMIEEAKASGEERGDRIEDGWDELGISPRMGMTKEELERSRTVRSFLCDISWGITQLSLGLRHLAPGNPAP